jgi:rod shape determining protein RodA
MRDISRTGPIALVRPEDRRSLLRVHWPLALWALALCAIGLFVVRSASTDLGAGHATRQAMWIGVGIVAALALGIADYRRLGALSPLIWGGSVFLLAVVLGLGTVGGGARSWLRFGAVGFQPIEVAKVATILFLARVLSSIDTPQLEVRHLARVAGIVGLPSLLLILQPDLGGVGMFGLMTVAMLLIAGLRLRWIFLSGVCLLILGGVAWQWVLHDYQKERVLTFLMPERDPLGAGYQVRQSKIAVGSGGISGRGYLEGTQSQLRFLPARHTDFVFAVLAEEWGFIGVAVTLALFALYIQAALLIGQRARDRLGVLMVAGVLGFFVAHVIYNTAMVVGLLPITGIPIPFLSYGGSFVVYNLAATGLLLGIDYRRYVNR